MTLTFAFSSDVCRGSRQHCLLGHVCTSREVAAVVAGEGSDECNRVHCLLLASLAASLLPGSGVGGYS